jgi:hypothetical protein
MSPFDYWSCDLEGYYRGQQNGITVDCGFHLTVRRASDRLSITYLQAKRLALPYTYLLALIDH